MFGKKQSWIGWGTPESVRTSVFEDVSKGTIVYTLFRQREREYPEPFLRSPKIRYEYKIIFDFFPSIYNQDVVSHYHKECVLGYSKPMRFTTNVMISELADAVGRVFKG